MKKFLRLNILILLSIISIAAFWGCNDDDPTEPTGGNQPPTTPSNPNPANGSADQLLNLTLSWNCSDPDGDTLFYDVYFGSTQNPSVVSADQIELSYQPSTIQNNSTYYWKITAKDTSGNETSGPLWSFSTPSLEPGLHIIGQYNVNDPSDVFVYEDYAYISYWNSFSDKGVLVLDVSDPATPSFVTNYNLPCGAVNVLVDRHNDQEDYLYITSTTNYLYSYLYIIDVTDPLNPIDIHSISYSDNYPDLEEAVAQDTMYFTCADSLRRYVGTHRRISRPRSYGVRLFLSDYLYTITSSAFKILTTSLDEIGSLSLQQIEPEELVVQGNYAFLACGAQGFRIVNISNPYDPALEYGYITANDAIGITVVSDLAFIAIGIDGMQIFDISDPASPDDRGTYLSENAVSSIFYYEGYLYITTGQPGLLIAQFIY